MEEEEEEEAQAQAQAKRTSGSWKKNEKDGGATYSPGHEGSNAFLSNVKGVGNLVMELPGAAVMWKEKRTNETRSEEEEGRKIREAMESEKVANVVKEDGEFLPGGEGNVLLRLEYMTALEIKRLVFALYLGLAASMAYIICFHLYASSKGSEVLVLFTFDYISLSVCSALAALLVTTLYIHYRKWRSLPGAKHNWVRKQRSVFLIGIISQILALISNVLHVISQSHAIASQCNAPNNVSTWTTFFNLIVMFTCAFIFDELAFRHILVKNSSDPMRNYPSRYKRWPHIVLYLVSIGVLIAALVIGLDESQTNMGVSWTEICNEIRSGQEVQCETGTSIILQKVYTTIFCTFFIVFTVYIVIAWLRLRKYRWLDYRWTNITLRLLLLLTLSVFVVVLLTALLAAWIKLQTCEHVVNLYSGYIGATISLTAWSISFAYICSPKSSLHHRGHFRQSVLMKFLWKECNIGNEIYWCNDPSTRKIPVNYGPSKTLDTQPVFVFETMIKLLWFSSLIYLDEDDIQDDFAGALDTALSLYDLKEHKVFYDPELQVRAIVAWGEEDIVVAFRGTKERSNVWSDIMAWRTKHPRMPNRGVSFLGRWWKTPLVHYGFLRSFLSNRIGDHVVRLVYSLVVAREGKARVRLTGHSLGGALSILCAYEVARGCRSFLSPDQIMCYTFGAPRVGNRYLSDEIEQVIPTLWNVVNNVDVIVFSGKLFAMYKHPGLRVMIDSKGDILVRPSILEVALRHYFFMERVADHFLDNYLESTLKICEHYPESRGTLLYLVRNCPRVRDVLQMMGSVLPRQGGHRWEGVSIEQSIDESRRPA